MTTATPQRPAPRPIKGSWEDLHTQAQQLARNYNDDAIPIYQRVFNGLRKLPATARAAGQNRLYNLMMTAGVELQGYFNLRDRYDESLEVIDQLLGVVAEIDTPQILELKSDVLLQAERGDEAVALLRELVESEKGDPGDWGQMVAGYVRMDQPEKALAVVEEMDKWLDTQIGEGKLTGEDIPETRYYQERLRIAALLELGRLDDALTIYKQLHSSDGARAISPHLIYTRLIQEGQYKEALRIIDHDQERQVRAAFWRGLTYQHMGEQARAKRIWEDALQEEFVRGDMQSMVEHILTYYYLGDQAGKGLEIVLKAQQEQPRLSWLIFMLTGIGWLMRGDENAAHTNFKLAVAQIKSMGEGKTMAHQYWRFVQDLVPADRAGRFAQYFDTTPVAAARTDNADAPAADTQATELATSDTTPGTEA